jgi:single-stranded DNA-binding protein
MYLIGRIVAPPKVKTNVNGKEFLTYTVATTDNVGGPREDGTCEQLLFNIRRRNA